MFHSSKRDAVTAFVEHLSYKQQINLQVALSIANNPSLSPAKARELAVVYWANGHLADDLKNIIGPRSVEY
ncbi:hypothetical protein [Schleiferilactobacillus harbinensis]|uniref:Uncharacterized protein n=1 Tax=Schleiferilactobacillus harbinensis TaxID=304207 RepID=A0ABU7T1V3_9LACO